MERLEASLRKCANSIPIERRRISSSTVCARLDFPNEGGASEGSYVERRPRRELFPGCSAAKPSHADSKFITTPDVQTPDRPDSRLWPAWPPPVRAQWHQLPDRQQPGV